MTRSSVSAAFVFLQVRELPLLPLYVVNEHCHSGVLLKRLIDIGLPTVRLSNLESQLIALELEMDGDQLIPQINGYLRLKELATLTMIVELENLQRGETHSQELQESENM